MKYSFIFIFAFIISNSRSESQLNVVNPPKLIQILNSPILNHSLANFGHVPYGRKLMGKVYVADPIDGCQPMKPFPNHDLKENMIILTQRGNCTFVTKSRYAQIMGASMVLVADYNKSMPNYTLMIDDGYAAPLRIPTFLISKTDGEKMVGFIAKSEESVVISASFKSNRGKFVNLDLWISFAHLEDTFKLIYQTKKVWEDLKEGIHITPHFYTFDCKSDCKKKNCYFPDSLKYCHPDSDLEGLSTGEIIVDEIIHQICIFNDYGPKIWFDYITMAKEKCGLWDQWPTCNEEIYKTLYIEKSNLENCINFKFLQDKSDNILLRDQYKDIQNRKSTLWPSITLNNMEFMGNHYYQDIGEAVCSELENPPKACISYKDNAGSSLYYIEDGVDWTLIFVLMIMIILIFVIMLYVFRIMTRKSLRVGMDSRVNEAVTQYLALKDSQIIKEDEESIK